VTAAGDPRRLRELDGAPGSVDAEACALLRAADGHVPSVGSKARVRAALVERRAGGVTFVLRPAVVLMLLLATSAGAMGTSLGRQWLGRGYRRVVAWTAPRASEPARAAQVSEHVGATPALRVAVDATPLPSVEPATATSPEASATRRIELRPAHHAAHAAAAPTDDPEDDPEIVAAAVRALRRDHDAARASALLDAYVRRWPNGALVEEAMALAIEAAQAGAPDAADGDARARALASRYLQRFPSGRFTETARRALTRPAP